MADHDVLVYELPDWEPELRARLNAELDAAGIPFQWAGDELSVPDADEAAVDEIMAGIDYPEALPEAERGAGAEGMDDEAVWSVMSALFDATVDLVHAPGEVEAAGSFLLAADRAAGVPVPFGIDEGVWGEVRQRAASLSAALEEDAEDDVVEAEARLLRAILARFV